MAAPYCEVLVDCLTPSLLRALSRLLQHTIGGADGLKARAKDGMLR